MAPARRSAKEIADEIRRLSKLPDENRDRSALLHEVQVYQEELTVQNEELLAAQADLEETRDRFVELYDFAPTGFMTLDAHGIILQINLTGAMMLGRDRQAIDGMPLLGFIGDADRSRVLDFIRRCRRCRPGSDVSDEFRLRESRRDVRLICRPRASGRPGYFTSMVDLIEQKRAEAGRHQATQARAALAGRLITIQEDERHRIARDMHDNVGQQMTALRLRLDTMAMEPTLDEPLRTHVARAQAAAEQLDRALDFIAAGLRPASLDLGFLAALEQFVSDWSATFGIGVELHAEGLEEVQLSADVGTHLYRVAQEALNNVYKHAGATRVQVIVELRDERIVMIVEDNGCGFATDGRDGATRGHRGLGLSGMRERAGLVGGTVEIESAPGKGTTVFFQVPTLGEGVPGGPS